MRSKRFRKRATLRIRPTAPFHFDGTFHKSSHFLVPTGTILNDFNQRYGEYACLAIGYVWEDLFWRHRRKSIPWLAKEIRL